MDFVRRHSELIIFSMTLCILYHEEGRFVAMKHVIFFQFCDASMRTISLHRQNGHFPIRHTHSTKTFDHVCEQYICFKCVIHSIFLIIILMEKLYIHHSSKECLAVNPMFRLNIMAYSEFSFVFLLRILFIMCLSGVIFSFNFM